MTPARRAAFVVPGGLEAVTGGNLYDVAVIGELRRRGWDVDVVDRVANPGRRAVVVVDSLALRHGPPDSTGPILALLHQIPSEAEGRPEWEAAERACLQASDLVVAVSEGVARSAARWTAAPVVVLPPGRDRACSPHAAAEGDVVLCVANAHPGKGVADAVEAFRRASLEGLSMVVVGDPDRDAAQGEAIRRAMSSASRVRLAGVLDASALADHYARARCLLTASRYEGWPMAVAEAMASGVPVVGYDVPGVNELVRTGVDGVLVPPGDVEALTAALRTATNPEVSTRLGRAARDRALGWPTWAETATRFADLMEDLATVGRGGLRAGMGGNRAPFMRGVSPRPHAEAVEPG